MGRSECVSVDYYRHFSLILKPPVQYGVKLFFVGKIFRKTASLGAATSVLAPDSIQNYLEPDACCFTSLTAQPTANNKFTLVSYHPDRKISGSSGFTHPIIL